MNKVEVIQRLKRELNVEDGLHLNLSEGEINEEEYQEIKAFVKKVREEHHGKLQKKR
ncbi:hypothetical protein ACQV2S_01325 [Facklamia sp. P13064]|uniref:hypothetical protein n=1 Tax=Facklamia sp. P13064 TaxID=3421953 RepID=UPI003D16ECAE